MRKTVNRVHRVAGQFLVSAEVRLPPLSTFHVDGPSFDGELNRSARPHAADSSRLVYEGSGWLGGEHRAVECHCGPGGYCLNVAGVGTFSISADGEQIRWEGIAPDAETAVVNETLLGPTLILALALKGTWCLHASAVAAGGHVVGFAGESGTGKSTLAKFLAGEVPGLQHVADDVLPIISDGDRTPLALPHFPQLKLRADEQPGARCAEQMPLSALYVLDTTPPGSGVTGASITPLEGRDRLRAFLSCTVAARLFDRDLLRCHADACARVAALVPVRRLRYPRDRSALPRVRQAIEGDLSGISST